MRWLVDISRSESVLIPWLAPKKNVDRLIPFWSWLQTLLQAMSMWLSLVLLLRLKYREHSIDQSVYNVSETQRDHVHSVSSIQGPFLHYTRLATSESLDWKLVKMVGVLRVTCLLKMTSGSSFEPSSQGELILDKGSRGYNSSKELNEC